jgi:ankyrin repeat domain-containing protein 50
MLTSPPPPEERVLISSSSVIHELSSLKAFSKNIGLAFFYCDGSQQEKQNPRIIFGSLLKQLIEQSDLSPQHPEMTRLQKFYETNKDSKFQTKRKLESLIEHILATSRVFNHVFIIVDGLDECQYRENLLEMVLKLTGEIHILVTSRREADIRAKFASQPAIAMNELAVQADIKAHIENRLQNGRKLLNLRPAMKEEIKQKLWETSSGMYIFTFS